MREPNLRLSAPSTVTVTSGTASDPISLAAVEEWRVKRLESSAGDLRYLQDGTPDADTGYFLTADDPLSEWHDCKGTDPSTVTVYAIGGDVTVEIGKKVRA